MANKYEKYLVEVVYSNGNKEVIKTSSNAYKEALNTYTNVKEEYKHKPVTINFIGVSSKERKIFFSKNNTENKELKTVFQLVEELNEVVTLLEKKAHSINDQISLMEKRKNAFEHKYIEFVESEDLDDKTKSGFYDQYRNLMLERRELKNEQTNLQNTRPELDHIIQDNKKLYAKTIGYINKAKLSTQNIIHDEVPEELNKQSIKEIPYKNDKDRLNIMKQIEGKYDKIVNDYANGKLICYNRSKKAM